MEGNVNPAQDGQPKRKFLGIQYVNCGMYGRIYKNKDGSAYVGHCPRCGAAVRIGINPSEGTSSRFFRFYCP